MILIPDDEVIF